MIEIVNNKFLVSWAGEPTPLTLSGLLYFQTALYFNEAVHFNQYIGPFKSIRHFLEIPRNTQ